jgi:choline dehydrogenase
LTARPETEYIAAPGYVGDFALLPFTQPKDGYQYATILGTIVAPLSRGNVTIKSTDTSDLPLINPNWLTSERDQQVAAAAWKRFRQAFATKFMSGVLADPNEYWPGAQVETDEQILEVIRGAV